MATMMRTAVSERAPVSLASFETPPPPYCIHVGVLSCPMFDLVLYDLSLAPRPWKMLTGTLQKVRAVPSSQQTAPVTARQPFQQASSRPWGRLSAFARSRDGWTERFVS